MGASRLLSKQLAKAKSDIKTRYLAGESVPSISDDYGISDRGVYYHLGKLSADDKGLHTKNQALRKQVENQAIGKEESHAEESQAPKVGASISDFIE